MRPTVKQLQYALYLLNRHGFSVRYMDSKFKELGATMRERIGTVEHWLSGMNGQEISNLITKLLARGGGK